ncbi:MAG: cell wall-binding repeat-containing protein [Coriobacteriia bacterium]
MKTLRLIISLALTLALAIPGVALGAAGEPPASEWRAAGIIVKPKPGRDVAALSASSTALASGRVGRSGLYRVRAGTNPSRTLAELRANPAVEWAEPDYVRELLVDYTSTPNDPDFLDQTLLQPSGMYLEHARSWYLRGPGSLSADTVWPYLAPAPAQSYGARADASAFPVAVIDSGFYMDHPDKGPNITVGKDCFDTYTHATGVTTTDDDVTPVALSAPGNTISLAAHGTCIAGEIAAGVSNGLGTAGAAYDAPVRVYKVQGVCVDGIPDLDLVPGATVILDSAVIDAIYRATDDGCRVINLSLGGPDPTAGLQEAIDYAHAHGVLVVAASGNNAAAPVQYPAACDHVIGVGSYRINSNTVVAPIPQRSSFTSYGTGLDLLAPGEGIWGFTQPGFDEDGPHTTARPGYTFWNGTSMATPLVAGGAAALWRLAPALTNDELAGFLFSSARDMGADGYDSEYGWGAYNMSAARYALVSAYPELAAPTLLAPPAAVIASANPTLSWLQVPGQSVTYRAALDGDVRDLAETSVSYRKLSEGPHTATITAMSPLNWWHPVRSATTVSFVVDTIVPAAPTVTVASGVVAWNLTEPELRENRVRIDGGEVIVLPGTASSYLHGDLPIGRHLAEVQCVDRAGNASAWSRAKFTVNDLPETPAIASLYTTADGSIVIDWPDAPVAASYRYVLDAAPPVSIEGSSLSLSGLGVGRYRLWVGAVTEAGTGAWAMTTLVVESSPVPPSLTVNPIEGTTETGLDRVGTAVAVSRQTFPEDSSSYVLIATAYNWPDALGGSGLAGALEAPILLTRQDALPDSLAAEIARLGAEHVIVLGGTGAVSNQVLSDAWGLPNVQSVERIAGGTRYETAAAVAERTIQVMGAQWEHTAIVATGEAFPDALGSSPLSAARGWPVYLVHPDPANDAALAQTMQSDGVQSALVLGGTGAVSAGFEALLIDEFGEANVTRLGGADRYETAVRIARYSVDAGGLVWDDLAVATGEDFPDALAGGVLQGRSGSVMLLTPGAMLAGPAAAELRAHAGSIYEVRFLGGAGALSPEVRSGVASILAR